MVNRMNKDLLIVGVVMTVFCGMLSYQAGYKAGTPREVVLQPLMAPHLEVGDIVGMFYGKE